MKIWQQPNLGDFIFYFTSLGINFIFKHVELKLAWIFEFSLKSWSCQVLSALCTLGLNVFIGITHMLLGGNWWTVFFHDRYLFRSCSDEFTSTLISWCPKINVHSYISAAHFSSLSHASTPLDILCPLVTEVSPSACFPHSTCQFSYVSVFVCSMNISSPITTAKDLPYPSDSPLLCVSDHVSSLWPLSLFVVTV